MDQSPTQSITPTSQDKKQNSVLDFADIVLSEDLKEVLKSNPEDVDTILLIQIASELNKMNS